MTDPVGAALGALGTADLCIKYGKLLYDKYRSYKDAEREITELTLILHDYCIKFEFQINFLRQIWSSLDERLQVHQNVLLHTLQLKLQEANTLLDMAIGHPRSTESIAGILKKPGHVRKGYYALKLKDCLLKSIEDLGRWHSMFDPSWFLITLVNNKHLDQLLAVPAVDQNSTGSVLKALRDAVKSGHDDDGTSIWLSEDDFSTQSTISLSPSLQQCTCQSGDNVVLINTFVPHPSSTTNATLREVRKLARVLSKADPSIFGLLSCLGVIRNRDPSLPPAYKLVLSVPRGLKNPRLLRLVLQEAATLSPLNNRLHLARQLANSTMYIHSSDFVHKNIRPETVVLFSDDESPRRLGSSFLVGFEKLRPAESETFMTGDLSWEKDVYRHPARQGLHPEDEYIMQHDIYSLGVCLLEIGLSTSFVIIDRESLQPTPNPILGLNDLLIEKPTRQRAARIKGILVDMAAQRLPLHMGQKYTDVVLACLKCLDKSDNPFGDERDFEDADGILVGVRYIETVILKLQDISI